MQLVQRSLAWRRSGDSPAGVEGRGTSCPACPGGCALAQFQPPSSRCALRTAAPKGGSLRSSARKCARSPSRSRDGRGRVASAGYARSTSCPGGMKRSNIRSSGYACGRMVFGDAVRQTSSSSVHVAAVQRPSATRRRSPGIPGGLPCSPPRAFGLALAAIPRRPSSRSRMTCQRTGSLPRASRSRTRRSPCPRGR